MHIVNGSHIEGMGVIGSPPHRLVGALAVIAKHLHAETNKAMAGHLRGRTDYAQSACILSSIVARDFLCRSGFPDAEVTSVNTILAQGGQGTRIGAATRQPYRSGIWNGHLVVSLPTERCLIDTTLFARMPQWTAQIGMFAVPWAAPDAPPQWGLPVRATLSARHGGDDPLLIWWLATP